MADIEFPKHLLDMFQQTSFCPHETIAGETGWNALRVEYDKGSESEYPSTLMYQDYHVDDRVMCASRAFADWGRRSDGEFVKAVVDWLQTMTQARKDRR